MTDIKVAGTKVAGIRAARSPRQLAWARLRRDRTATISGTMTLLFLLIALAAPLIETWYGVSPHAQFQDRLDTFGMPLGYSGGISGDHWFGIEPQLGRDIFIRMVHGLRTSLFIALAAATVTTVIGILAGIVAGYLGGWIDAVIGWITDFALALPFLIFALAVVPTVELRFYGPREDVPAAFRVAVLIAVFAAFGWTGTARLVRGQVISLREREFVDAAPGEWGGGGAHLVPGTAAEHLGADLGVLFPCCPCVRHRRGGVVVSRHRHCGADP